MQTYTYDEKIFSDMYKDAHGFRPSIDHPFYSADPDEKQQIWDQTLEAVSISIREEEAYAQKCLTEFEKLVQLVIDSGAGDRHTALRWITASEDFRSDQCIEYWAWEQGILFTDEGNQLIKDLAEIHGIKLSWRYAA